MHLLRPLLPAMLSLAFFTHQSMKYLCLVYFEGKRLANLSPEEKVALDRDSFGYDLDLKREGHFVFAEALDSPKKARTVSVRGGKTQVEDGSVGRTKEQLGGFILIKARDIRQAVKLAAGIPLAKLGRIEVRPIYEIPVR
jgi:hypothetical protein